jgi:predicted neutral ceramidase superfamily lipid hydrolase
MIISSLQVLLLVSTGAWYYFLDRYYISTQVSRPEHIINYGYAPLDIVLKLNFPLAIPWALVSYLVDLTFSGSRPRGTLLTVVVFLCVLATVALFWYFVVAEVQERSRGSSLVRFSSLFFEIPKILVLAIAGGAAFALAFWDGHRLVLTGELNRGLYWSGMIRAVVGGLFLVAWALILIKASIQDLMVACRKDPGKSA